jgi:hypothetical protein
MKESLFPEVPDDELPARTKKEEKGEEAPPTDTKGQERLAFEEEDEKISPEAIGAMLDLSDLAT